MEIPDNYRGDQQVRLTSLRDDETGHIRYGIYIDPLRHNFRDSHLIPGERVLAQYDEVNPAFTRRLGEATRKIEQGKLQLSSLEEFLQK